MLFVASLRSTEMNFVSLKLGIQPGNTMTAVQNYTLGTCKKEVRKMKVLSPIP